MKLFSSLFAKILAWFFMNMLLVAVVLVVFFAFQPYFNLHAVFGQQGASRLRTAGMLIVHDLNKMPQTDWQGLLARHAAIHGVDFAVVLPDGAFFSSTGGDLPLPVLEKTRAVLRFTPPEDRFGPPPVFQDSQKLPADHRVGPAGGWPPREALERRPPGPSEEPKSRPPLMMRTKQPTRYWTGIQVRLVSGLPHPHLPVVLLAVSDSVTGHGFFFDPLPWMVVSVMVMLISTLFWIPMVRNITRPLTRMTRTAEQIAKGRFEVVIHASRADEIGRLARAINHMTARLSAFVKGQKRFLGDVAHELGSPIARIQFGLGALEQRVGKENHQRVSDVMEDVDHMSKLVNELLAFSRAEMKADTVKLEKIALLPVVETAVARETKIEGKVDVRVDPDIRVVASAELLTRALANLVRNAIKYTGGKQIEVSAERKNGRIVIEVRDAGPGVPEHYLDQLFEPFFRPEVSRDRNSGGVGLGLTIVRTCVETCDGVVSARNLQPNGFAVSISLKA